MGSRSIKQSSSKVGRCSSNHFREPGDQFSWSVHLLKFTGDSFSISDFNSERVGTGELVICGVTGG